MHRHDRLPEPSAEALAHSNRLRQHIEGAIDAAGGWIPFSRYMELALYAPGLGYYTAGSRKLGREGDFTTAPELTPLFGHALAQQARDLIAAGLRRASEALQADLRDWAAQVAAADDPVAALVRLVESYLADRNRARIEYELYLAAARDARLRPLAETWVRGLRELLEPHVGDVAARGIVALLDGVLIQALVTGADLDGPALATAIRRLAGR